VPVLTFDDWSGGLDVRPAAALSKPNILRVLTNAYITTGKSIKKRPCLEHVATLEAGTVGLKAFGGKLNTFYGQGAAITHANGLFVARRVPHWTSGAAPTKIHFCDQYNALMYVAAEYAGQVYRHHYLDDPGAWAATTAYSDGTFKRPTTANGFRYEVTAGGGGNSGGSEPTWPTTIGATVVDGALTWTCRTFAITDANCPHSKQVMKQAQKIFAIGSDGTTVPFCKTGDPRDWTSASDAGFLPVGLYSSGSAQATALAPFRKSSIAVLFSDNAQVWFVDPDPALHEFTDPIASVGTIYHRGAAPVQQDTYFLAQNGFRSMSFSTLSDNLQDSDVGSPIDALVRAEITAADDPIGLYYPKLGQFWEINGSTVWAFSFSRTSKLSAWSRFTLPFAIDDAAVLNQELYLRSGDDVYKVSEAVFKDGASSVPLVDVQMFYQDGKAPGVLKMFTGAEFIGSGEATVSFRFFDENGAERESLAYEYPAISEPGGMHTVELLATRIAPHIQHQADEAFELSSAMLHFEKLGAMV
jgi:hypothetical protein